MNEIVSKLQSLLSPLDYLVEKNQGNLRWGVRIRFCKNAEDAETGRYTAELTMNQVENTCYVNSDSLASNAHDPLEVCDLYTRVGQFIRASGFKAQRSF
jgi:sugar/nucleoside kinase (ribokinase family)